MPGSCADPRAINARASYEHSIITTILLFIKTKKFDDICLGIPVTPTHHQRQPFLTLSIINFASTARGKAGFFNFLVEHLNVAGVVQGAVQKQAYFEVKCFPGLFLFGGSGGRLGCQRCDCCGCAKREFQVVVVGLLCVFPFTILAGAEV